MKKKSILTCLLLASGTMAFAQGVRVPQLVPQKSQPLVKQRMATGSDEQHKGPHNPNGFNSATPSARAAGSSTQIGETVYDLQTNSSIGHRIVVHPNGTISAIWTTASDLGPSYTNRGTGYNYFDGTNWIYPDPVNHVVVNRFESIRTGFPDMDEMKGKDLIMNHQTVAYVMMEDTNTAFGQQPFTVFQTDATVGGGPNGYGAIWPRMAVGGQNGRSIHVVANYSDTLTFVSGVKQPMVYSRSRDGGATWDIKAITLPGYDSTATLEGSAENYAIDAKGDTVVIVNGGIGEHLSLWRSFDNGSTFSRFLIDSFPYAPDVTATCPLGNDSTPTNDGSCAVIIDDNGVIHVAYGYTESGLDATGASVYRPGTVGLIYWNSITNTKISVPITMSAVDANQDGTYSVGSTTTAFANGAARYGNNALLNKPSIGVDPLGRIYIAFSLPADADTTSDGQSFRDIWVVNSKDNGQTWTEALNLTETAGEEEAFPCLAKRVTESMHFVYQWDAEPGTALTNTDPDGSNYIFYMKVDTNAFSVGLNKSHLQPFSVGQNYPNPVKGLTNFNVILAEKSDVSYRVTDMFGRVVIPFRTAHQPQGQQIYTIDCSGLSAGIYFYEVHINGRVTTKKMVVK